MAQHDTMIMKDEIKEIKPKRKVKKTGVTASGKLNKYWSDFLNNMNDYESLPINKWTEKHLIHYACFLYKKTFGADYSFDLSLGGPNKTKEMILFKQLKFLLNKDNSKYIKEYIDWVFEKKINKNKSIYSLGFVVNPAFCNEFKNSYSRVHMIKKSTALPQYIVDIGNEIGIGEELVTYRDLIFIKMAIESNDNQEELCEYRKLFEQLRQHSFDPSSLDNITEE